MTDFFADLEKELRAAHPRRPKPVVPVRPVALAVTVLVALAVVASFVPSGEQEVAQQPPAPDQGWTAYAPLDAPECGETTTVRTVNAAVPELLRSKFVVLREGSPPERPVEAELLGVSEIFQRGVRVYDPGPGTDPVAILPVRFGCAGQGGDLGMCLVRLVDERPRPHACAAVAEDDFIVSVVEPVRDGLARYGVLASDSAIGHVDVRGGALGGSMRTPEKNFIEGSRAVESAGEVAIGLTREPQDRAVRPLNCAGQPEMGPLKERFAIFREPPAESTDGIEMALPEGHQRVFLTEARVVELGEGRRYVVVPVGDDKCATNVCLVRMGTEKTACTGLPASAPKAMVVTLTGEGHFAGLVTDGVRSVAVETTEGSHRLEPEDNIVAGPVRGKVLGVYVGS